MYIYKASSALFRILKLMTRRRLYDVTSLVILTFCPYASQRCAKLYKIWLLMIKNFKVNIKNTKFINYLQNLMHA